MNILVLSDTHGHDYEADGLIRRTSPDALIFAGDGLLDLCRAEIHCPVYAVKGNCDFFAHTMIIGGREMNVTDEEIFSLDGVRILLMHGHRYAVKSTLTRAVCRAAEVGADLLIYGHTHEPVEYHLRPGSGEFGDILTKPLTVFNPGSLAAWPPSFGTLTIREGQLLCAHGTL